LPEGSLTKRREKQLAIREIEGALNVIQTAIHNEIAGQRFYSDAALSCIDPWAKEIFATLAEEEQLHTRLLLVEYEALTNEGRWIDPKVALISGMDVDVTQVRFADLETDEELFPAESQAKDVVDRRVSDLDALAFGIGLEEKAIDLYSQVGESADEPAARESYRFLVKEETRHYHQLRGRWEALAGRPFSA
jgi:rubrerythrin